jgi:hypothetical protein
MNPQTDKALPQSTGPSLKALASRRAEEHIDKISQTLRRVRTLLLVISISVPVVLATAVFILWRAVSGPV